MDLSEFEKLSGPRSKCKPCGVAAALEQLEGEPKAQLEAALLEDPGVISNAAISRWLEKREMPVKWQRVRSHRIESCVCYQ